MAKRYELSISTRELQMEEEMAWTSRVVAVSGEDRLDQADNKAGGILRNVQEIL